MCYSVHVGSVGRHSKQQLALTGAKFRMLVYGCVVACLLSSRTILSHNRPSLHPSSHTFVPSLHPSSHTFVPSLHPSSHTIVHPSNPHLTHSSVPPPLMRCQAMAMHHAPMMGWSTSHPWYYRCRGRGTGPRQGMTWGRLLCMCQPGRCLTGCRGCHHCSSWSPAGGKASTGTRQEGWW